MDDLIKQFIFSMKLRDLSETTLQSYEKSLRYFFEYLGKDPLLGTPEDVQRYQVHLIERKLQPRTINCMLAPVKFFYTLTLQFKWPSNFLPWVKVRRKAPKILTQEEIGALIARTSVFKVRMVFLTMYACGLRTCEIQRLTYKDIDSNRMQLHVIGKGRKERLVPIADTLLHALRFYWKENKENKWTWLFPGEDPKDPISGTSIRRGWNNAKKEVGLVRVAGVHTLRHCYATHLLEAGVDLRVIQILLGHTLLRTTTFYTQLTHKHAAQIKNPLDLLAAAVDPRLKASGQD